MIIVGRDSAPNQRGVRLNYDAFCGSIYCSGQPQRRTWYADVQWRFRSGGVKGVTNFENKHLTSALMQLIEFEQVFAGYDTSKEPGINELRLYCGFDSLYSVLRTATQARIPYNTI